MANRYEDLIPKEGEKIKAPKYKESKTSRKIETNRYYDLIPEEPKKESFIEKVKRKTKETIAKGKEGLGIVSDLAYGAYKQTPPIQPTKPTQPTGFTNIDTSKITPEVTIPTKLTPTKKAPISIELPATKPTTMPGVPANVPTGVLSTATGKYVTEQPKIPVQAESAMAGFYDRFLPTNLLESLDKKFNISQKMEEFEAKFDLKRGAITEEEAQTKIKEAADIEKEYEARKEELAKNNPMAYNVGSFAGELAGIMMISSKFKPLEAAAKSKIAAKIPSLLATEKGVTILRMLSNAASMAPTFGTVEFIKEAARQIEADKFSPTELLARTLQGTAFGAGLAVPTSLPFYWQRLIGMGSYGGGWTALEKLIRNKQITSEDIPEIAQNTLLFMAFETANSLLFKTSKVYEADRIASQSRWIQEQTIGKESSDLLGKVDALKTVAHDEYLKAKASGNELGAKSDLYIEKMAQSVSNKIKVVNADNLNIKYLVEGPDGTLRMPKKVNSLSELLTDEEKIFIQHINDTVGDVPPILNELKEPNPIVREMNIKSPDIITQIDRVIKESRGKYDINVKDIPPDIITEIPVAIPRIFEKVESYVNRDKIDTEKYIDRLNIESLSPEERKVYKYILETVENFKTPNRDFESYLFTEVDPMIAARKITNIAKDLGVKIIITEKNEENRGIHFNIPKRIGEPAERIVQIQLNDLNRTSYLLHETGHLLDTHFLEQEAQFTPQGTIRRDLSVSYRLKLPNENQEFQLRKELLLASKLARPFIVGSPRDLINKIPYRSITEEMLADYLMIYMANRDLAQKIAPTFTQLFEQNRQDVIQFLKKYDLTAHGIRAPKIDTKGIKRLAIKILRIKSKEDLPEGVKYNVKEETIISRLKKNGMYLGLPYWRSMLDPLFKPVYFAADKFGIREVNFLQAEMTNIFMVAFRNVASRFKGVKDINIQSIKNKKVKEMANVAFDKVSEAIFMGNEKYLQRHLTRHELRVSFTMNNDEINLYNAIVKIVKMLTELKIETIKYNTGYYNLPLEKQKEIDVLIRKQVARLGGYFPIDRFGKYVVYGEITRDMPSGREEIIWKTNKEIFYNQYETEDDAREIVKILNNAGYTNINFYTIEKLPKEFFDNIRKISFSDLNNLVDAAGADTENPEIIKLKEVMSKAAWDKHLIQRKWVPGYPKTWEHLVKTLSSEITAISIRYGKAKARYYMLKSANQINRNTNPESYAYAHRYIKTFFEANEDEWVAARALLYSYYLSFKISFAFQNLTQTITTTIPEISTHVGGPSTAKYLALAIKDAMGYASARAREKAGFLRRTVLLHRLLDKAVKERVVSGMLTEQLLGSITARKTKITLHEILGILGNVTEMANRTLAACAAYRIAIDKYKLTDETKIYEFMVEFVNNTQFPYGPQNFPIALKEVGRLKGMVKTMVMFRMFMWNYLSLLYYRLLKTGKGGFGGTGARLGPKGVFVGTLVSLGGLMALPFASLILWVLNLATGKDWRVELKKALGEENKEWYTVIMNGTFSSILNVSNMIGVGDIISPSYDLDESTFGVGYSTVKKMIEAIILLSRGDIEGAKIKASPVALSRLFGAIAMAKRGKTFEGDVYAKVGTWDIIQNALGFTPPKVKEQYEINAIIKGLKEEQTLIMYRYKNKAKQLQDQDKVDEIYQEIIDKHNEKAYEYVNIIYMTSQLEYEDQLESILKSVIIEPKQQSGWFESVTNE